MDPRRFDALTRKLGRGLNRRAAIAALAGAGAAAAKVAGGGEVAAQNYSCGDEGCACATGSAVPCNPGLVCCPLMEGIPGAPGVCTWQGDCRATCRADGDSCGDVCGYDSSCTTCCRGYCNSMGFCGDYRCSGPGCSCATGTYMPCDAGLVCCSSYPGMPGAQGTCQYDCPDTGAGMAPVGSSMP